MRTLIKVLAVSALLSTCGAVIVSAQRDSALDNVTDYRHWTRVTREPLPVQTQLSSLDPSSFAG
jgi:hypothetical protein